MNDYKVVKYTSVHYVEWNSFVSQSKNGTFLFHRDFMEYHKDRFEDFSLMVFKRNKLVALLPAHIVGGTVYSHKGLSYGGFLVLSDLRSQDYILSFSTLLEFLEKESISSLFLKTMPYIYNKSIGDEIRYVLSVLEAKQDFCDSYFVIDTIEDYKPNRNRKRAIKLAKQKGVTLIRSGIEIFWSDILIPNLKNKFNIKPVHSIDEILYLQRLFPDRIVFFGAKHGGEIKAGVVMFITETVAHFQYSSGTDDRTQTGALDFLFHEIIKRYHDKKYISFGSSSTDKSLKIDAGLSYWKESFGAHLMAQDAFTISVENHFKLKTIFK